VLLAAARKTAQINAAGKGGLRVVMVSPLICKSLYHAQFITFSATEYTHAHCSLFPPAAAPSRLDL
jgi:hypothetical protein